MSAQPSGYTTVAPWIVTEDTGAFLDFVVDVFGGEELGRVVTEDGAVGHGEVRVGDTVVLAFDRREDWPVMPSLLRVFVEDADGVVARAVASGGRVVTPVMDSAF
ncbi:VOC family protein, partial [Streptomyces niveiscabiei]